MLDLKFIRENPEKVKENCKKRNIIVGIDRLLKLDKEWRKIKQKADELRHKRNRKGRKRPQGKNRENIVFNTQSYP